MESIKIRKTLLKLDNFGRFFLKIYIHISLALKKVIILNIWKGKIVLQEKDYNVQCEKKHFLFLLLEFLRTWVNVMIFP